MPYISLTRESNSTQDICIKAYEIKKPSTLQHKTDEEWCCTVKHTEASISPEWCAVVIYPSDFTRLSLRACLHRCPSLGSSPLPVSWCAFTATVKGFDNDLISLEAVHKYWLNCRIASKDFIEFLINQLRSSYRDTLGVDGRGCWFTTGRSLRCGAIICWLFWWKRQNGIIEKNDFVINSKGCRG